jgi:metal-responsive CopG/Arc/MetJ family transcriptional regulator
MRNKIVDENDSDQDRKVLTQRMPDNLVTRVDNVSQQLGISRNAAINLLVKNGLNDWE